jgi:pimeloyl-ACP methyl ester carboxylesterase
MSGLSTGGSVVALWKITKRLLAALGVLIVILACSGAIYQWVATSRDASRFPPPGVRIPVEGRCLHVTTMGSEAPTVVFDSMIGASSLGWAFVQPRTAKLAATLAYDRAGYGWSDPGTKPRNCLRLTEELHQILSAAHMPRPYVLVGSSFGGCVARLYAFRHAREVAGLVLVDPAHEDQLRRMPAFARPLMLPLRLYQAASQLGILRLANMPVDIAGFNVLPPEMQSEAVAVGLRTQSIDALVDETAVIEQSFSEVRAARERLGPHPLDDKPTIVLTHREDRVLQGEEAAAYAVWVDLHRELARESTRGRQVIVEHSSHFIPVDQPDSVVDAVRTVVEEVRSAGRLRPRG